MSDGKSAPGTFGVAAPGHASDGFPCDGEAAPGPASHRLEDFEPLAIALADPLLPGQGAMRPVPSRSTLASPLA